MNINFPDIPGVYTQNCTVAFQVIVDGEIVFCEIAETAINDCFGPNTANGTVLVESYEKNREAIQKVAAKVLPYRLPPLRCLIVTSDF